VVVLFYFFDLHGPAKAPTSTPTPLPSPVVGLAANQIQQVVIHSKGNVLTIAISGSNWTYSLCPEGQSACTAKVADPAASAQLFQGMSALRPSSVVFGAPDGLPAYGVDKPTTAEIDIKGITNSQVTILVGLKSPDSSSYYLRRQDSNDVLAVAVGTIDGFLALVDKPPAPVPTPSAPAGAVASPAASP
jgi:hypothetical protein